MKRVGIVSYNMYGNFTNYGSALQTWALHKAINSIKPGELESIVIDYCPDILKDKDILNPMENMWDTDEASRERCRLSLPAIKLNYEKFQNFYKTQYHLSGCKYTSENFNQSREKEGLDGYVCGSDTVFAVPEFGFDDGFYANYDVMRGNSVAYAASFGDWTISETELPTLQERLRNFKGIALREKDKLNIVEEAVTVPVYKVTDPTLLLHPEAYETIVQAPEKRAPYLLLYSRRYNKQMDEFAYKIAKEFGLEIVEISLNAANKAYHEVRYDAGVEEFLGLVKHASMVVTNSFHGMIFAVQFKVPFYIFSRKLCDGKIQEMLELFDIDDRLMISGEEPRAKNIDYEKVHRNIAAARANGLAALNDLLIEK